MGLLFGWDQYVDITIPDTQIDADLTYHPILVKISTSCGIGSKDASFVFDENGSNSLKIAFTEAGLTDEKYAEVEKWDAVSEVAWIWVSKSDLVLDADGNPAYVLRLYFDNDHADNTTYIGISGVAGRDGPRENVWDSAHKMVQHMNSATDAVLIDSTTNDNDSDTAHTLDSAAGKIGLGMDNDGSEYAEMPNAASLTCDAMTISALAKMTDASDFVILTKGHTGVDTLEYYFQVGGTDYLILLCFDESSGAYIYRQANAVSTGDEGSWVLFAVTFDGGTSENGIILYRNGVPFASTGGLDGVFTAMEDLGGTARIGRYNTAYATGVTDEVRLSNSERTPAWIKADYNFQIDNVLSWGDKVIVAVPRHGFVNFQEPGVF